MNGLKWAAVIFVIAACLYGISHMANSTDIRITEIERVIDPSLLKDGSGNAIEHPYAELISFANPSVSINPEDRDELLIKLDVINDGDMTVTRLGVEADFYNKDGRKAADEGDLLAHNLGFGDNSSPVNPHSRKRAVLELDSPEDWTGGKMVITIDDLRVR